MRNYFDIIKENKSCKFICTLWPAVIYREAIETSCRASHLQSFSKSLREAVAMSFIWLQIFVKKFFKEIT